MIELAGIALALLALCIVASVKGPTPALVPLLVVAVPLPLVFSLIGVFPDAERIYMALRVIELADSAPTAGEMANGGMTGLVIVFAGLVLSLPAYALALVVLCLRSFRNSAVPSHRE